MSNPGSPVSESVGSSGTKTERLAVVTATALNFPAADLLHRVREIVEHELRVAGEQRLQRRRAALVGDVHHVDMRLGLEQLAGEVAGAAVAAGAERQFAGIRFGVGDQLGHGAEGCRGIDHEHVGRDRDQRDGREILDGIVGELAVQTDVDRVRGQCAFENRVAIRCALGHEIRADIAAGAGPIVDDHGLAPGIRQLLPDRAGDDVERPSGRGKGTTRRMGFVGYA